MVSVAVRVLGGEPSTQLRETLDVSARIGREEGLGDVLVVRGDEDLPEADLVVTALAGVLPDARALWRMAEALVDPSIGTALARQLPLESPDAEPAVSFAMVRRGAGPGPAVVVPDAVVFRDERLADEPWGPGNGGVLPVTDWLRRLGATAEADRIHGAASSYADAPFLTLIMRTQGRRSQELREALLSLAAQTSSDFEVLVVPHRTGPDELRLVEAVVAEQPASLRDRVRVLPLADGGRAAPLNHGLEHGRGRYLSIFDDDDIALAHWVETFAAAEALGPGRMLRSVVLTQEMGACVEHGRPGVRASGPLRIFYDSPRFSLVQHVVANQTPPVGWVLPRWLVDEAGLRFDDTLTTNEDWELLLRAAELAGVTDTWQATSIYRRYGERESSSTLHSAEEWEANRAEIRRRMAARPLLLPAGETDELRLVYLRVRELERTVAAQARDLRRATRRADRLHAKVVALRGQLRGR